MAWQEGEQQQHSHHHQQQQQTLSRGVLGAPWHALCCRHAADVTQESFKASGVDLGPPTLATDHQLVFLPCVCVVAWPSQATSGGCSTCWSCEPSRSHAGRSARRQSRYTAGSEMKHSAARRSRAGRWAVIQARSHQHSFTGSCLLTSTPCYA